ncbi:MAG TPA: FixH family protein [Burkholderiales bacterium]|nr:FixH family protein [Burkholderiales bacterium]
MIPWYRERWPWILMSGPAAVIVAGTLTTWMAFATSDGLVADDYYKRGLGINAVLGREQAAVQRGISARVERAGGEVRVVLRGAEPPVLFLSLTHATRAGIDVRLRLERAADGSYRAALQPLAAGHWRAAVDDPLGQWRVVQETL